MSLVVFTALVGLSVALGRLSAITAFVALLCIAGGAGAAGALNMWYDADIDAMMTRTAMRPIPRGRVSRPEALTFGLVLAAGSIAVMGLAVNIAAAALLAFTIFFYVIVFTMLLKRYAAEALGYPKEMPVLNDAGDPTEVLALQKTGIDGTQGYLEWLGLNYPRTFATMLGRVLPMQLNIKSRRGSLTLIQWTVRPALSAPAGLFLEVHIYARRRSP